MLEKRFGLRVAAYGLRQVFRRVPDHAALSGIAEQHLENWRGAATILPPRLEYLPTSQFSDAPTVRWCGIPVSRLWRCGNRGNVASVLIEKPARGDFLPILDGGYSLQYSPLMEYHEGQGMVLFCQLDVTGRTERDPVAETLARNLLDVRRPGGSQLLGARSCTWVIPRGRVTWNVPGFLRRLTRLASWRATGVLVVGPGGGQQLAKDAAVDCRMVEGGRTRVGPGTGPTGGKCLSAVSSQDATRRAHRVLFRTAERRIVVGGQSARPMSTIRRRDELPLLHAGATVVGDGMLGVSDDSQVVFCQLPPDRVQTRVGIGTVVVYES